MKSSVYTALPEPSKVVHVPSGHIETFYVFPNRWGHPEGYRLSGLTKNNVPDKRIRGSRIGISKQYSYWNGVYAFFDEEKEAKAKELRAQRNAAEREVSRLNNELNELYAEPEKEIKL